MKLTKEKLQELVKLAEAATKPMDGPLADGKYLPEETLQDRFKFANAANPETVKAMAEWMMRAQEVINWYALAQNYMPGPSSWDNRSKPCEGLHTADMNILVESDGGKRARAFLKEFE